MGGEEVTIWWHRIIDTNRRVLKEYLNYRQVARDLYLNCDKVMICAVDVTILDYKQDIRAVNYMVR